MCDPKGAHIRKVLDGNADQRAAIQLVGDAHAGNKGETDLKLDEALDGFHGRQLEGDIERRMVLGKSLHHLVARTGLDVMCQERLIAKFLAHNVKTGSRYKV